MRRILSLALTVIAVYFFCVVCFCAFVSHLPPLPKWAMVLAVLLIGGICLAIALALRYFKDWRKLVGVVLVSSSGLMILTLTALACAVFDDALGSRTYGVAFLWLLLGDYLSGGTVTLLMAILGSLLLRYEYSLRINYQRMKDGQLR